MKQRKGIYSAADRILDMIYPKRCPICSEVNEDGMACEACKKGLFYIEEPVCKKCGKQLEDDTAEFCYDCQKYKHYFEQGKGVFVYKGDILKSVYDFKYYNKKDNAVFYGSELAKHCGDWIRSINPDGLVPVPIHKNRKKVRGYNQAELIARQLGELMDIPVFDNLVERCKETLPQKDLDDKNRKNNLKNAFKMSENIVKLESVVLVDDIYTTGSTMDEVSRELRRCGVKKIYSLALCIGQGS